MLVVVGGQARKVGKTSVVCGIISGLREWNWAAVKITPHHHETRGASPADSARFLAAGAAQSYWIRTAAGELHRALPLLRRILSQNEHVIIESNSVIALVTPDFCVMVVDGAVTDFKPSAHRILDRADAFVVTSTASAPIFHKPAFHALPPEYRNEALLDAIQLKNVSLSADTTSR